MTRMVTRPGRYVAHKYTIIKFNEYPMKTLRLAELSSYPVQHQTDLAKKRPLV